MTRSCISDIGFPLSTPRLLFSFSLSVGPPEFVLLPSLRCKPPKEVENIKIDRESKRNKTRKSVCMSWWSGMMRCARSTITCHPSVASFEGIAGTLQLKIKLGDKKIDQ